jgi:hypothetical protein
MLGSKKGDAERRHFESLLPWYAAGTLGRSDADRVAQALAADVELARCYSLALEELAGTIYFNETLGEPSAGVAQKLFAAIDAEEARAPRRQLKSAPRPGVASTRVSISGSTEA